MRGALLFFALVLAPFTAATAQDGKPGNGRYVATIEVKHGDVVRVYQELFRQRGVHFIIRDGVRGRVTCSFYDFDWELILDYLAKLVNAQVSKDENGVWIVEPAKPPEPPRPRTPTGPGMLPATPPPPPTPPADPMPPATSRAEETARTARLPLRGNQGTLLGMLLGLQPQAPTTTFTQFTYLPGACFPAQYFVGTPSGYAFQYYNLMFNPFGYGGQR